MALSENQNNLVKILQGEPFNGFIEVRPHSMEIKEQIKLAMLQELEYFGVANSRWEDEEIKLYTLVQNHNPETSTI